MEYARLRPSKNHSGQWMRCQECLNAETVIDDLADTELGAIDNIVRPHLLSEDETTVDAVQRLVEIGAPTAVTHRRDRPVCAECGKPYQAEAPILITTYRESALAGCEEV